MNRLQADLVAYGTYLMATRLGHSLPILDSQSNTETLAASTLQNGDKYAQNMRVCLARELVHDTSLTSDIKPKESVQTVVPIFKILTPPPGVITDEGISNNLHHSQLRPPKQSIKPKEDTAISHSELWDKFWTAIQRLPSQSRFDTFFYLLANYGRNLPGTVSDPLRPDFEYGISVFEQFKAVVALSHCLETDDKNQSICLLAGDMPGIQRVLYTITSKGAAKTLRGHSAYLLLLNDCLVRVVLKYFELPQANVVFNAGGNFLIVAPADAERKIGALTEEINEKLLDLHRGDIFLALAGTSMPARLYADSAPKTESDSLAEKRYELQLRLEASKHSPFSRLSKTRYKTLFGRTGNGGAELRGRNDGNLCEICQTEVSEKTRVFVPEESESPDAPDTVFCEQCHSFGYKSLPDNDLEYDSLAWNIGNAERIFISRVLEPTNLEKYCSAEGNPPWNIALRTLGLDYRFIETTDPIPEESGILLSFNPDRFLPTSLESNKSYGFYLMSRLTPRNHQGGKEIRDFHRMAREDATGIPRYGVLRMDIDSLGETMHGTSMIYNDLVTFKSYGIDGFQL